MLPIQILAIILWLCISLCAIFHFKRTVLVWMMARVLFNAQIAVRYNSPGMSLVIAVDMTLILLYLLGRNKYKKSGLLRYGKFPLKGAFAITLVSFVLSSLFAIVPINVGLVATLKYFVSNFGILYVFFRCLDTKADIVIYVKTAHIIAVLITSLGLYEIIFKDNPWLDFVYLNSPQNETTRGRMFYVPPFVGEGLQMRLGMVRAYSFMGIHIAFGTVCVYLLYLFATLKYWKLLGINGRLLNVLILLLLSGVVASNSKTPILGVLMLLFAFYSIKQLFQPKVILPLLLVFAIIIVYVPSITMSFMSLFDSDLAEEAGGSTVAGRQKQFDVALRLFSMNPLLGNGIGSISVMRSIGTNGAILGAESSLMQILPERGLLGLAAYMVTYWSLYAYGKKYLPRKLCIFYLLSLGLMEFVTGILDMPVWIGVYFCVIRMFQLKRNRFCVNSKL